MAKSRFKFNGKKFGKKILNRYVEEQTNRLIAYAQEELDEIVLSREFDDRTRNLVDSYLWAVYCDGKLKGFGTYHKQARKQSLLHEYSPEMSVEVNGRKLAMEFKKNYKAQSSDKYTIWEIVFAACAPYGAYLEAGFTFHGKRYQFDVMSQRYDDIKNTLSPLCKVTLYVSPPQY
jgi:hypothetical protein